MSRGLGDVYKRQVIGQIAAPCLGAGVTGPHIHLDQNIVLGQNLCGLVLAVGVVGGILADVDLTGLAGQPDADLIDREVTGSVADGAEDAAPVGVAAKDSGFEEVGADHAAADGAGRLEVGGRG